MTLPRWIDGLDEYPEWRDMGKTVEFLDGDIVRSGKLAATDFYLAGDDETPIWSIEVPEGYLSLTKAKWRFHSDATWEPHSNGFVFGDVGVFPCIPDAWAVWVKVDGEWQEAKPFTYAARSGMTHTPGGNPPYDFWERSREETIEEAKRLALNMFPDAGR